MRRAEDSTQGSNAQGALAPGMILAMFFLTGASGLVYEVVAARLLRVVIGNTVLTTTTVLTAFMAGLALGGLVGGRLADAARRPLRLFAWFEIGAGLYCLALPWLIESSQPLYREVFQRYDLSAYELGLFKFAFCGVLLLVPAIAMGASLPILCRCLADRSQDVGPWLGKLYACNSVGAALGVAGAAFVLLPALGTNRTLWLACGASVATGLVAWRFSARKANVAPAQVAPLASAPADEPPAGPALLPWALLAAYAASGFASLVYEVAWTRTLSLLIGSSVYAFSLILATFILGLALGSLVWTRLAPSGWRGWNWLVAAQACAAGFALLSMPLCSQLPELLPAWIAGSGKSFWRLQALEFAVVSAILLPPTVFLGAAFPAICQFYARSRATVGRSVGAVYAAGSVGSILGASIGGLLLIPRLGLQHTIWLAALFNLESATVLALLRPGATLTRRLLAGLALQMLAVTCGALLPAWNASQMTMGPKYGSRGLGGVALEDVAQSEAPGQVVFYREDDATTVTVRQSADGQLRLFTDGAPEAASLGEATQTLLAHAPLLLHPRPRSALVIGLGSGITLGCAGLHPLDRLDCVELSAGVVRAAHLFDAYNHRALTDPRVRLYVEDGRNFLELRDEAYDVIISQPSNLWIAGVGDLYTREFFELCARRLRDGGLACVWLNALDLDEPLFRCVLGTFQDVFPAATLWEPSESNFLLIGSQTPWQVDARRLAQKMRAADVRRDLERIGIENAADLCGRFVMGQPALNQFTAGVARHTDDNSLLEFSCPRTLSRPHLEIATQLALQPVRGQDLAPLLETGAPSSAELLAQAQPRIQAAQRVRAAALDVLAGHENLAVARFRAAADLNPRDAELRRHVHRALRRAATARSAGQNESAQELYRLAVAMNPYDADARHQWGVVLSQMGESAQAEQELAAAVGLDPRHVEAQYSLGALLVEQRRGDEARPHFEEALRHDPKHALSASNLAGVLIQQGDFAGALSRSEQALRAKPDLIEARFNMGLALDALGRRDDALKAMRRVLRQEPDNPFAQTAVRELMQARP